MKRKRLRIFALFFITMACNMGMVSEGKTQKPKPAVSTIQNGKTTKERLDDSAFEDYDNDDSLFEDYNEVCDSPIKDPIEPWNRIWFHFNDFFYMRVAKPVYMGYKKVTPQFFRTGVNNFFCNLQTPIRVINSILQGKIGQAWVEFGKFIINTTVGLGGFVNVAQKDTPRIPVNPQTADFGHTLSTWGFGEGFFIIWPIIGPSTVRDTFGMVGDIAMGPFFWFVEPIGAVPALNNASSAIAFIPKEYGVTGEAYLNFNNLDSVLIPYESVTKSAIEPYVALRDAYVKFRRDKKNLCRTD